MSSGSVRRYALATGAVVGLICIVIGPVRSIAVVAPLRMRTAGAIDRARRNSVTHYHTGTKGGQWEPASVIISIARTIVIVSAVSSVPIPVATIVAAAAIIAVSTIVTITVPVSATAIMPPVLNLLDVGARGFDTQRRKRRRKGGHRANRNQPRRHRKCGKY
jgi:hypothetical protein